MTETGSSTTKDGATLFAEMNRLLVDQLRRSDRKVDVDGALTIVSRVLQPYLRNRFSMVNATTIDDQRKKRLRIRLQDHAERCIVPADDLVLAFQELQPCPL